MGVKSMEMRQTPPFEIAIVIDSKNLESKSHVRTSPFWPRLRAASSLTRACALLWRVDELTKIWVWRCRSLGEMSSDI